MGYKNLKMLPNSTCLFYRTRIILLIVDYFICAVQEAVSVLFKLSKTLSTNCVLVQVFLSALASMTPARYCTSACHYKFIARYGA